MSRLTAESICLALQCDAPDCACHKPGGLVHCPAHQDDTPSLSVTEKNGKILVKCFGGCPQDRVIAALKERGLWPSSEGDRLQSRSNSLGDPVNTYNYHDAEGNLTFQVCRYRTSTGKTFRQRRPDGQGGWVWGLKAGDYGRRANSRDWYKVMKGKSYEETKYFPSCPLVPYLLPQVLKADTVFVVEGEKDADALADMGLAATTNPGGAGKWRKEYNQQFQCKAVMILPDNDAPGRAHAQDVAQHLHGVAASIKVVEFPGLPVKGDVLDWLAAGGSVEKLLALAEATPEYGLVGAQTLQMLDKQCLQPETCTSISDTEVADITDRVERPAFEKKEAPGGENEKPQHCQWELATQLIPRIPFPWEVLPTDIADSLKLLGRACATSPHPLPGAAFCMMSSIMGRTMAVSPKEGWDSPLITWHMDIRESGEGKTPPVRLMARPIHEAQKREQKRFEEELMNYDRIPRKDRDQYPAPTPARGYFVSDLTLEGLREDVVNSPHGGLVVIQDEISAFLTGQNQYKLKGTDREAWLSLHDGHPARTVRAGRAVWLDGARVSIFGGIQPLVFKTFFAGESGLYLSDGTLFRFLATCEPSTYYDLTAESWGDRDRAKWETVLERAMDWVDAEVYARGGKIERPIRMILDSEAQGRFLEWRNHLHSFKDRIPPPIRGFLPKATEYCLRLTGIIHCIQMFFQGGAPQTILSLEDLERGISTVQFYLGQIQGALRLIEEDDYAPPEISERTLLLGRTLEQLRSHLENGRLAISFIQEKYNKIAPETQEIGTARAMGGLLRSVRLTTTPGKHDANGKRSVYCLEWNTNTETFIKQCLQCLQQDETKEWREFDDEDIENSMSATSATSVFQTNPLESALALQTSKGHRLNQKSHTTRSQTDITDIADITTEPGTMNPSPDWQEMPEEVITPQGDPCSAPSAPEPNGMATPEPGLVAIEGKDLVQCGNCQKFTASQDAPGGRGYCQLQGMGWDGKMTQFSDYAHQCSSFILTGSIKNLGTWDEAVSKVVEAAVQALNPDEDLKEVVIP